MQQNPESQQPAPSVDAEDIKEFYSDDMSIDSGLYDDQSWFWTESWQAGEQEADRDKAEGRIIDLSPEDIQARIRALDT